MDAPCDADSMGVDAEESAGDGLELLMELPQAAHWLEAPLDVTGEAYVEIFCGEAVAQRRGVGGQTLYFV